MAKQELIESVSCNLRSVTQSCKGGVPLQRLERDYRDLLGTQIPYRDLGFNSLEAFLRTIPKVISLKKGKDGFLMAEAVADSSTAHIASLISRQKQSKTVGRGSKRSGFSTRRGGFTTKYGSRGGKSSYSSYHSTSKFSGRSNKQEARPSTANHSKTSPLSFKIRIDNTNRIPKETTAPKSSAQAPIVAPLKVKSAPTVAVRGYEVAPRFLRLYQRKIEAEKQRDTPSPTPSQNSTTSTRNSSTPPRTPTPPHYMIPPPSAPSIAPPKQFNAREASFTASSSSGSFPNRTSTTVEGNGLYSNQKKSIRPLRARLTLGKSCQQLDAAQTAKEYIEIYAKMNNIPFEYSTRPIGQKKKNKGFVSNLNLGGNKYMSYPEMAPTEEEAEEIAAQNAVTKIKESQVLPETPISNAEEIQILLNRIEELVYEKPSGMFINGLLQEYENQFNEQLPSCWVDLLQQSSAVDIDEVEVSYGKVPEGANFIVRPAKGLSSGSTTPSEDIGKIYPELQDAEDDNVPREEPPNDSYVTVPPLMIPAGNEWGVYVTDTSSCVAARLIDYDEGFLELQKKMSLFYDSYILPVQEVVEKQLYSTSIGYCIEGDLVMHRVLANKILENDMIECYYVDEGSTKNVMKTNLQELHEDFLELPYQAIHFTLDGLEEYEPFLKPEHLEPLKHRSLVAVVKRWCSPYEDFLPDDPGIHKILYSVVLYDTSNTDDDICVNDIIKKSVPDSYFCKLPKLNVSSQGFLTHVTTTGQIYLRFLHPERSWLEYELERLSPLFEEACSEPINQSIPAGKICVAKFTDEKWYRVVVPEHPTLPQKPDMIEVIFVDYGNSSFVKKSEVCDLLPFSEFLSNLGYQAKKCELFNALPSPTSKWTDAASQKLTELAPFDEELIIRVIEEGDDNTLPKVNLHKRIYAKGDSLIISVNENLANKPDLFLDLSAAYSTASNTNGPRVPSQLNLPHTTGNLLSKGSLNDYVPGVTSPIDNLFLKNLETASPCAIEWMLTPDNVRSPEEEECLPSILLPPEVPDKGELFDVFVTMAATPHNFTVQSLQSSTKLDEMMENMQQFYSTEENLIEMHPSLLQRNCYYAALHSDNAWYRVKLVSPPGTTLMAYYVDFGDFNEVRIQNLQKLYKPFRALPCQAIKASLAGIKPIEGDWNPVHCVKFKEMVTEKKFVARMHSNKNDPRVSVFEIILIDTSDPNKDVYIHELLIANSMALQM